FWLNEFTKYSQQFTVDAISPIQNKVGQFLSSSLVRNIISQTHSTIDMGEIMDNKKILIINLAKGKVGEDYSALLGAMLITKIQLAAMGRADVPEEKRKDFYLYVDEFQNFATESFAGILSEARKYKLNLIVAHQYIGQLEEEVRDAIFGNVGTLIAFRVGAADAEFLEKEFEPVFMMNDLVNLAKYDIYLKLMIDGVTGDAFSATTLSPSKVSEQSNTEKIIRVSRERYANKREVVEEKISRWSGMNAEKKDNAENNSENLEKRKENKRENLPDKEMWDAICAISNAKIKVPFQPDPKRETYCKDCLVAVRRQSSELPKSDESENNQKKINDNIEVKKNEENAKDVFNKEVKKDVVSSVNLINNSSENKDRATEKSFDKNLIKENIGIKSNEDLKNNIMKQNQNVKIKEGEVIKF
ncbi:MAG: TraM recognition domain-containing protein, partial [Candidatus Pacebacteria bacterium]|nr:TraM recognition domain-containing protein [Candidatus Paceibacterota bacterium]